MTTLLALLVLAASLAALAVFEKRRGARRLATTKERLLTGRFELDPKKLIPAQPPADENAAIACLELAPFLQGFSLPAGISPPQAMQMVTPTEATSFVRKPAWRDLQGNEHAWESLRSIEAEGLKHLARLAALATRPRFVSPVDVSKGLADMELKALGGLPGAMRVLRTTALLNLHNTNDQRAAHALITLLNLFPTKSEDRFAIAELVRTSFARAGFALTWELIQHATLPDQTWATLQSAWERAAS